VSSPNYRQRLEHLPEMQRKVLALYYFEDLALREIAEVFGVTESRISQIHAAAILPSNPTLQKYDARKRRESRANTCSSLLDSSLSSRPVLGGIPHGGEAAPAA
jgi:predicted DNA-binding protein YlxM (UPF0122 family)